MTLQSSGAISALDILEELYGERTSTYISLNDADCRNLAGKSSGLITFADFYGKSALITSSMTVGSSSFDRGYRAGAYGAHSIISGDSVDQHLVYAESDGKGGYYNAHAFKVTSGTDIFGGNGEYLFKYTEGGSSLTIQWNYSSGGIYSIGGGDPNYILNRVLDLHSWFNARVGKSVAIEVTEI